MKITKYPQSCLRLEKDGKAIMIDIGSFVTEHFRLDTFDSFEALLITHQHADHFDPGITTWLVDHDVAVYANENVAQKFPDLPVHALVDGQSEIIAGFQVTARDLPHCKMADGSDGPPNTGYVVNSTFFHPGDGTTIENLQVETLAVPIAGPSISMHTATVFVRQVGAKTVIPIHYSNPVFYNDPNAFSNQFKDANVIVLQDGEETEV
jgi:L-ascorbate metabolism protein UlaG (beta-lactamase superfamily)